MSKELERHLEQKQLWEINDVILNNNYVYQDTDNGLYYTLMTSRSDLPAAFFAFEREQAMTERENAEALVSSSGREAQSLRRAGGAFDPNYELPSQKIANADTLPQVSSSGKEAQRKRGKKEKRQK